MYMQAHDVARSLGTDLQIFLQAHEMSGARGTSFTFIVRPVSFRGLLDPDSNSCAGPHEISGSPWDLLQIYVQVHEIPGSPGTSFKFMYGSMRFQGPLGPPPNSYTGP